VKKVLKSILGYSGETSWVPVGIRRSDRNNSDSIKEGLLQKIKQKGSQAYLTYQRCKERRDLGKKLQIRVTMYRRIFNPRSKGPSRRSLTRRCNKKDIRIATTVAQRGRFSHMLCCFETFSELFVQAERVAIDSWTKKCVRLTVCSSNFESSKEGGGA